MSQVKIRITKSSPDEGGDIVGILQRSHPSRSTQSQPIALLVHGILSHKDQIYHRPLANALAGDLGMDSFRYDLTGQGGETEGKFAMANFDDDVRDLERVIDYLREEYGYVIHVLIAHSRGSIFASYYLSTRQHVPIPLFVNVSGRLHMDGLPAMRRAKYDADFGEIGYSDWHVKIAGKAVVRRITREGSQSFADWDNSYLTSTFPDLMDVLTIHGTHDEVVPITDAEDYHSIFSKRTGSSSLVKVALAGHNFIKPFDEPTQSIVAWVKKYSPVGKLDQRARM